MCFWHDVADWCCEVEELWQFTCVNEKCKECYRNIPGMLMHTTHQQQYEECQICENEECECKNGCCECRDPDYGDEYDYYCCNDCFLFLKAVEEAEIEEGCARNESRPGLEGMLEEIHQVGMEDAKRYFKKAAKMYPELVKSKYLGWLWGQIF